MLLRSDVVSTLTQFLTKFPDYTLVEYLWCKQSECSHIALGNMGVDELKDVMHSSDIDITLDKEDTFNIALVIQTTFHGSMVILFSDLSESDIQGFVRVVVQDLVVILNEVEMQREEAKFSNVSYRSKDS